MAQLHSEVLNRLAVATDLPLQGISQGARVMRPMLGSRWQRKLRDLDAAFAIVRHLHVGKVKQFLEDLDEALQGVGKTKCCAEEHSEESSGTIADQHFDVGSGSSHLEDTTRLANKKAVALQAIARCMGSWQPSFAREAGPMQ